MINSNFVRKYVRQHLICASSCYASVHVVLTIVECSYTNGVAFCCETVALIDSSDYVTTYLFFIQARCTQPGEYLANFETLEEAMTMKAFLQQMNTGSF